MQDYHLKNNAILLPKGASGFQLIQENKVISLYVRCLSDMDNALNNRLNFIKDFYRFL